MCESILCNNQSIGNAVSLKMMCENMYYCFEKIFEIRKINHIYFSNMLYWSSEMEVKRNDYKGKPFYMLKYTTIEERTEWK